MKRPADNAAAAAREFWVDRGGTFTDCIGIDPQGAVHIAKILSSDSAPVEGIRGILERAGVDLSTGLPPCTAKLGSTIATNALLERRGVATVLVANEGLADVFEIGTQQRPELFELDVRRPPVLHRDAVEVAARIDVRGEQRVALDSGRTHERMCAKRATARLP